MSITLVTGVPGSGKSYYCMDMLEKMLKTDKEFLVLTNIEGLSVEDSRVVVCDWKRETNWFQNKNQEQGIKKLRADYGLSQEAKIIYIIDEAQRFFPPELKDNDVVFFFDYHRHYGLDIFLVTQHLWKLSKKIGTLVELEYRAVNNRINPLPYFIYKVSAGGEQFKTEKLKKRKEVFALYCSFQAGTKDKSDATMLIWILVAVVVGGIGVWLWRSAFAGSFGVDTDGHQLSESGNDLNAKAAARRRGLTRGSRSPSVVPASYDTEPVPVDSPPPAESVGASARYQAPVISRYVKNTDSVSYLGENGFEVTCKVCDFIERFPTMLYGYGYLHASYNRFIVMDSGTHDIIFPVHYSPPKPAMVTPAARSDFGGGSDSGGSGSDSGGYRLGDIGSDGLTIQDKLASIENQAKIDRYSRMVGGS